MRMLDPKCHPFPVIAHFERVIAVSFAFPEPVLRPFVPPGLQIDTYKGLGFLTVAMVWTKNMRPAGFPRFLGRDFFLAGYRIFTRLQEPSGRRLRGLKIIRSETDKQSMVRVGNLLTGYSYRYVHVRITESASEITVTSSLPGGALTMEFTFGQPGEQVPLPPGSPFPDWHTARLFAGPMPFTFSPRPDGRFVVVEGRRQDWAPRPIPVARWDVALFREEILRETKPILANAFTVENIDYRWEKGRIVSPSTTP